MMDDAKRYMVRAVRRETHDTVTLALSLLDGSVPPFVSGQFITVYFPELNTPEGKAYSISSAPHEETLDITIKAIGEFSNRLCAMVPGDTLLASAPYGFFYSERTDTDLIMVAGGIGATPFRSIILDCVKHQGERSLHLMYSVRSAQDTLFQKSLEEQPGLELQYFVTREPATSLPATTRRLTAEDILAVSQPERSEYFLCGSIAFVRDLWRGLTKSGVPEDRIYTEAFFSH